jgi:hypothetical protein
MDFDRTDVVHYIFVLGVVVSGVFLERGLASLGDLAVFGSAFLLGAFWLVYYKVSIVPRLSYVSATRE